MSDIESNTKLFQILNNYFMNNIKTSFISKYFIIIITIDDKVYAFERNSLYSYAIVLCSVESKVNTFIEDMIVMELCDKSVINIKRNYYYLRSENTYYITFLTSDGRVYEWKYSKERKERPLLRQELINENIIDINCGYNHTLVLTSDGRVYGWGHNLYKQISAEDIPHIEKAVELNLYNGQRIKAIACGDYHSLALTDSGCVYGWGNNRHKQIDCNSNADKILCPTLMTDILISDICCGYLNSYLLSNDGIIYLFGTHFTGYCGTNIIKIDEKINNIYSDPSFNRQIIFSTANKIYILGKFGKIDIREPLLTEFNNIEDVYMHYLNINYKPIKGFLKQFREEFFKNGKFGNNTNELKKLGEGGFGQVFKVNVNTGGRSEFNRFVAIKQNRFKSDIEREFINEIITCPFIKDLKSDYIVRYSDIWIERNAMSDKTDSALYIQMGLCDMSLYSLIDDMKQNENIFLNNCLTEMGFYISSEIFNQILKGVQFLHSQNPPIIHRDLNLCNILIKFQTHNKNIVKIADFGLSTIHRKLDQIHSSDVGNIRYAAPEVLDSNKYDTRADIYSLGIICKELFSIDMNGKQSLIDKYEWITNISEEMAQELVEYRYQSVEEVMALKNFWALDESDFYFKQTLKSIIDVNDENNEQISMNRIFYHLIGCRKLLDICCEINVKRMFTSKEYIFIISIEDKFYKILRKELNNLFSIESNNKWSDNKKFIKNCIIEELSYKHIIEVKDFKSMDSHYSFAFTTDSNIYFWNKYRYSKEGIKIINTQNVIAISVFGDYFALLSKNGSIFKWNPWYLKISEILSTNEINRTDKWVSISGIHVLYTPKNDFSLNNPRNGLLLGLTESGCVYRISDEKIISIAEHINNEYDIYIKDKFKDVVFKKISCGEHHCLLLSNDGIIYTFGENGVGQLGLKNNLCNFNIIEINEKFIDIATHYSECISIAVSENGNVCIWSQCGNETIYGPKLTEFKTIDEVFIHYFDSDYSHFENRISS